MQSDSARLYEFAADYTAAWCSQDAASVAAFFAPDGSLTINGGVPSVGRIAITDAAQSFMTAFPDLRVVMDQLIVKEGRVEYHWTLTGKNTAPGGTNNPVRISGFECWQIDPEGLIASSQGYFDADDYGRQLQGTAPGRS
jgi:uncharacterized protein (TIGR02246 family)